MYCPCLTPAHAMQVRKWCLKRSLRVQGITCILNHDLLVHLGRNTLRTSPPNPAALPPKPSRSSQMPVTETLTELTLMVCHMWAHVCGLDRTTIAARTPSQVSAGFTLQTQVASAREHNCKLIACHLKGAQVKHGLIWLGSAHVFLCCQYKDRCRSEHFTEWLPMCQCVRLPGKDDRCLAAALHCDRPVVALYMSSTAHVPWACRPLQEHQAEG